MAPRPPGGGVERDERPEDAARRELREETGLVPSGQLWVIGVFPQHVYGRDSYCITYACTCDEGDVVVSDEHTAHRWIDASDYRDRYFSDDIVSSIRDTHLHQLVTDIRDDLDRYLQWKELCTEP